MIPYCLRLVPAVKIYKDETMILQPRWFRTKTCISRAKLNCEMLQKGETYTELVQHLNPKSRSYDRKNSDTGNTHVAFCVSDIDKDSVELKQKGVKFNAPPMKIDSGVLKGKFPRLAKD
jgi:hypothetical protein